MARHELWNINSSYLDYSTVEFLPLYNLLNYFYGSLTLKFILNYQWKLNFNFKSNYLKKFKVHHLLLDVFTYIIRRVATNSLYDWHSDVVFPWADAVLFIFVWITIFLILTKEYLLTILTDLLCYQVKNFDDSATWFWWSNICFNA